MKQLLTAAFALVLCALGSAMAAQAGPHQDIAQPPGELWRWPLDDYGRAAIGQDNAEYDACLKTCDRRSGLHHTGFDIPAPKGTPVRAVADGFVVNLVPNDKGCTSDCTDHGDGNTIILQHGKKFSHYQHLLDFRDSDPLIRQVKHQCGFYDRLDENGVHISGWECTEADNVAVQRGDIVGYVGGTGSGRNKKWPYHLHFEAKTFPALYSTACYTDSDCCPKGKCFGYVGRHPFQVGYADPVNDFDDSNGQVKLQVQVGPQGEGIGLLLGPDAKYDLQTRWHSSDGAYWAIRQAVATRDCDQGWYKLIKVQHFPPPIEEYFAPTGNGRPGAGTLPDTWVCIGNGSDQYVVTVPSAH